MRLGHVLAAGDVVQEEQGLCAAADDVVDAHGHAVDAHGVVLVHQEGDLELGAHAVGAADQHRALRCRSGPAQTARRSRRCRYSTPGIVVRATCFFISSTAAVAGGDVHARRLRSSRLKLFMVLPSPFGYFVSNWYFPASLGGIVHGIVPVEARRRRSLQLTLRRRFATFSHAQVAQRLSTPMISAISSTRVVAGNQRVRASRCPCRSSRGAGTAAPKRACAPPSRPPRAAASRCARWSCRARSSRPSAPRACPARRRQWG